MVDKKDKKEKDNETTKALEKKTKAEIEEALGEDWMNEKQTIQSKHFFTHKRVFVPAALFQAGKDKIDGRILALKIALRNPDLHAELIAEMLNDVVVGAYKDRSDLYHQTLKEYTDDGYNRLLKLRQSADRHLFDVLKAARDIKRPPVQVVVKQADQVNISEQLNVAEKQVNLGKTEQPPK